MPIVTTAAREKTMHRIDFSTVSDWCDNKIRLQYGNRTVMALDAVEMRDPLHPFAWGAIGKQMLFHTPYVHVGNDEWVDARLLTVQE